MAGKTRLIIALCACFAFCGLAQESKSMDARKETGSKSGTATAMDTVLGKGEASSYPARMNAVHRLGTCLSPEDIKELCGFLHVKLEGQALPALQFNAIKNDIVNVLMAQKNRPESLGRELMEMFKDKTFDPTWRDYCIQFLGTWLKHAKPEERKEAVDILWEATGENGESISGTALISLIDNLGAGIDKAKLSETALAIVRSEKTCDATKVTAIQICARLENGDILALAREVSVSEKKTVPVRMSAIGAIGILGGKSDLGALETLAKDSDSRIKKAAEEAIKKIGKKN